MANNDTKYHSRGKKIRNWYGGVDLIVKIKLECHIGMWSTVLNFREEKHVAIIKVSLIIECI